jgi:hypothetical protein
MQCRWPARWRVAVPVARAGKPIVSTNVISSLAYEGLSLPVAVLLDNVRSMYNVGAFFRAAYGVGLQKLCLCGITSHPPKKAISRTARKNGHRRDVPHFSSAAPLTSAMPQLGLSQQLCSCAFLRVMASSNIFIRKDARFGVLQLQIAERAMAAHTRP